MTRRRSRATRRLLAGAAAGAVLVLSAATGAHAVDGSIVGVERSDEGLELAVDVPADAEVDLDGVTATVNGTDYPADAALLSDDGSRVSRTTVLAIDTSDSMNGDRFVAAKAAATTFLDAVPDDVEVGVVGFSATVTTALEPTADRSAAREVIDGLELSRGTRLYEAVLASVALAGDEGQGKVLVLSDGADTGTTPLDAVVQSVAESGVVVDVVALEQNARNIPTLTRLAGDAGEVIRADSADLGKTFSAEAAVLARQVGVSLEVPADLASQQISISVSLPSSAGTVLARSTIPASTTSSSGSSQSVGLSIPVESPRSPAFTVPGWVMYAGVAIFAIGLVVALLLLVPGKPLPMSTEDRVSSYTTGLAGVRPAAQGGAAPRPETGEATLVQANQAVTSLLNRNRSLDSRIASRLAAAGSELKSSEWLLTHAAVFIFISVIGLLVGRGNIVVGLIFMIIGAVAPWIYLRIRASRRRKKFDSLLPETLQLMSGSLSAGLSLMQSVDTIVREGAEPVRSEFKRVLVETRLGVSLEDAMEGVADRFESRDFRWVVMAIRIQRQVGGNLGELLNTVADTMREREYIRRQVNALAAEGKLSAYVLGALPVLFLLYLLAAQGDYVRPLFEDARGLIMLGGTVIWLFVGVFWMSKLVKVEV
ncbi:type II secretion system F family protein [Nocardioides sp.]|uniref:type II secretion system F family protein n=1 Tax=Nocardioides sp. TaxID=35761 RepID=UPI002B26C19B|nr:type II secretion system F family protein [Nocardioides sp.]